MRIAKIHGWDGFELSSSEISIIITPSIGGRIMSLKYKEQELLFVDQEHQGETFDPSQWKDLCVAKKKLGFRVWGGDKTWIAPQNHWLEAAPPLDLDAAPYEISWHNDQAVMTSPICRETGLQIIRRVKLDQGQVYLTEELYNRTDKPLQKGLWNVTQIKSPCSVVIPADQGNIRSYHHEDKTLPDFNGQLNSNEGFVTIACDNTTLFKIGGLPRIGRISIHIPNPQGEIVWNKNFTYDPYATYAHASAVEVFNSSKQAYAEVELHAPHKVINPGECVRLEQLWCIINNY